MPKPLTDLPAQTAPKRKRWSRPEYEELSTLQTEKTASGRSPVGRGGIGRYAGFRPQWESRSLRTRRDRGVLGPGYQRAPDDRSSRSKVGEVRIGSSLQRQRERGIVNRIPCLVAG